MSKITKGLLGALIAILLIISLGITGIIPWFSVIPDMVKVGIDYISLDRNKNSPDAEALETHLSETVKRNLHPFVLADINDFDRVRRAYSNSEEPSYVNELITYVIANADALLDKDIYPVLEYVLDEEDSILPVSREMINRMVVLGFAWQITGEDKYALRAEEELQSVLNFPDWCNSHFLASAEMALAVSLGYDWLYDYLDESIKQRLSETVWNFAIYSALNDNHWFTWSKNNWNSICYSGIGIACMTFAEYDIEKSAKFLHKCYKNMPIAFENFTPDGVYAEGSGYCQSGMDAIVNFISSSNNYLGTDFGLSQIDGLKELGSFPLYISTPKSVFNFGDNKNRLCYTPSLFWFSEKFSSSLLCSYQMTENVGVFTPDASDNVERNGNGKNFALSALWYNSVINDDSPDLSVEPLALRLESDLGQSLVLMRSAYLDENATFAGIKAGYNFINHGDLDIGSFIFECLGERWAEELGPGAYDAPGYFMNLPAGGRWKNYSKRAEGQNTLVINPHMTIDDQYALARCEFSDFYETANGGFCSLDMSDAYRMNGAAKVTRDFELSESFSKLTITDRIKCFFNSEIYWFMHTKADISLSDDKKTAILSIGDKSIRVISHSDGEFSVSEATALDGQYEYDYEYDNIRKLTVHLNNTKNAEICITLEPLTT